MTATNPTLAAAYNSLSASLDRQHADVTEAIDAAVSAHQHGGKDAFDDRIDTLRGKVAGMVSSMDAMRQVAGHIGSLPVKVGTILTILTALGVVLTIAGLLYRDWAKSRNDALTDALDTRPRLRVDTSANDESPEGLEEQPA